MSSSRTSRSIARAKAGAHPAAARRGSVLVLCGLLFFVIMGFAALTIDLGIARLTQRQMQTASDGMALEVLRERDLVRDPTTTTTEYRRDYRRRVRNARIGSWHFAPMLRSGDEADIDDTHGAGAYIDMRRGMTLINASQLVVDAGFSMPRPRPNYRGSDGEAIPLNLQFGDVVSGTYTGHLDPDDDGFPEGMFGLDGNPRHLETTKYERVDFEPAPPEDAPFADSIVARLRRTLQVGAAEEAQAFDWMAGVSSSGPRLPFLFGLGTTMHGGDPRDGYSPRFEGVAVRSTSIAQARPAVRIGVPRPEWENPTLDDGNGIGATAFVIHLWMWNNENDEAGIWTDEGNGNFSTILTYEYATDVLNQHAGGAAGDGTTAGYLLPKRLYRVGDRVLRMEGSGADEFWDDWKNWVVDEGYAPIVDYQPVDGGRSFRVIGFVRVKAERVLAPGPGGGPPIPSMKLWKLENECSPGQPWLAPRNASALFDGEQVSQEELDADVFLGEQVWNWNLLLRGLYTLDRAVHAPALVR